MDLEKIDQKYSYKGQLGCFFENGYWIIKLWQPIAKLVKLLIYEKNDSNKLKETIVGHKTKYYWIWKLDYKYHLFYYQYEITHQDNSISIALDPYAKGMAIFNWNGKDNQIAKAAIIDIKPIKTLYKHKLKKYVNPIIYEAHIKDLTIKNKNIESPGTFKGLIEINFAKYLKKLNFTHIQLLPLHQCFTINESENKFIDYGKASGWTTNYNWGYDPQNYFTLNGIYSNNPYDPYKRIQEFRQLIQHFHKNKIQVIIDVVFNHVYINHIFNNIFPNYYFRNQAKIFPVNQPPLASQRKMVRKLIYDSLYFYVSYYDVDGFRFDLSSFIDKNTINYIVNKLKKVKKSLIFHGEAWNFTDLDNNQTYIKGVLDNNLDFAYFNDTTRNAIKGRDDSKGFDGGLVSGNKNYFDSYLSSIIGNLKNDKFKNISLSRNSYDLFTKNISNVLNYVACHDGYTLWDKINLTTLKNLNQKLDIYLQAIAMVNLLPGKILHLQGMEILYSKPLDLSGYDIEKSKTNENAINIFNFPINKYCENSYKTSDFVNGLNFNNETDFKFIKKIKKFIKKINGFRLENDFFNLNNSKKVLNAIKFNNCDKDKLLIDYQIKSGINLYRVIHNFSNHSINLDKKIIGKIVFNTNQFTLYNNKNTKTTINSHTTIVVKEK